MLPPENKKSLRLIQKRSTFRNLSLLWMQDFQIMQKTLGVITLKIILFASLHNMYRFLLINGHHMNTQNSFSLKKKIYKMCCPKWPLGLPVLLRWPWVYLKRDGMHQKRIYSNDSNLTRCIWSLKQVQIFLSDICVDFLISQPWWFSEMVEVYAIVLIAYMPHSSSFQTVSQSQPAFQIRRAIKVVTTVT
jgi:hypothetical protein